MELSSGTEKMQQAPWAAAAKTVRQSGAALLLVSSVVLVTACATQRDYIGSRVTEGLSLNDGQQDFRNRWYAGASFGSSVLDPDLSDVGFTLQEGNKPASQLRLGYDLHSRLSVEVDSSVLGSAELESTAEVEYTSFAASGLIYGLTGSANRSRREKWSVFGRLGLGYSSVASNVLPLDGQNLSGLIVGLGVEYGWPSGLGIRLEATRFHDEALFAGIGAVYRLGPKHNPLPKIVNNSDSDSPMLGAAMAQHRIKPPAQPREYGLPGVLQQNVHHSYETQVTPRLSAAHADNFKRKVVIATVRDLDADGVDNEADTCPHTRPGTSVNSEGCGLFDGVIEGVTFNNGSAGIDTSGRKILERLAVRLLAFPEIRVEVHAHTDNKGPRSINQSVSESRAAATVRYLISKGVDAKQLVAIGKGETRPRADNETELGRLSNRRIELLTLPDRDIISRQLGTEQSVAPAAVVRRASAVAAAKKRPAANTQQITLNADTAAIVQQLKSDKQQGSGEGVAITTAMQKSMAAEPSSAVEPTMGAALDGEIDALPAPIILPGTLLNGVLEGVAFKGRSAELTEDSANILDLVLRDLRRVPQSIVLIMVHSDDQGTDEENIALTRAQAKAVSDYLVAGGIDEIRLRSRGYGNDLPLAQNLTESDRRLNRRVELRVLSL